MRLLILLIVLLLLAYALWPRPGLPPVEETFIGDQIVPLRKAENLQEEGYSQGLEDYRHRMDAEEQDGGTEPPDHPQR